MNSIAAPQPCSQETRAQFNDLVYYLILAIGAADLSEAHKGALGLLIHSDITEAIELLLSKQARIKGHRRVPSEIRRELSLYSGPSLEARVQHIRSRMMLVMSDYFYRSDRIPQTIEIRRPEMMAMVFTAAISEALEDGLLRPWETAWIRQAGQVLANHLIARWKAENYT